MLVLGDALERGVHASPSDEPAHEPTAQESGAQDGAGANGGGGFGLRLTFLGGLPGLPLVLIGSVVGWYTDWCTLFDFTSIVTSLSFSLCCELSLVAKAVCFISPRGNSTGGESNRLNIFSLPAWLQSPRAPCTKDGDGAMDGASCLSSVLLSVMAALCRRSEGLAEAPSTSVDSLDALDSLDSLDNLRTFWPIFIAFIGRTNRIGFIWAFAMECACGACD